MMDIAQFRLTLLALGSYQTIRSTYYGEVERGVREYLEAPTDARVTRYRNGVKRSAVVAFDEASKQGFIDGGGKLPYDRDFADYITARINAELGYIETTFAQLRMLKISGEPFTATEEASRRATSYARTLDQIYNEGKLRGAGKLMLTFGGRDGVKHCLSCDGLKGKRRQARWWVAQGLVPGQGNRNYDCSGFECHHFLYDDRGFIFTI